MKSAPPAWGRAPRTRSPTASASTWDVDNLVVADGGVFTSNAHKNPTLTIMALAWRSMDHLAERMRKGEYDRDFPPRYPGLDRGSVRRSLCAAVSAHAAEAGPPLLERCRDRADHRHRLWPRSRLEAAVGAMAADLEPAPARDPAHRRRSDAAGRCTISFRRHAVISMPFVDEWISAPYPAPAADRATDPVGPCVAGCGMPASASAWILRRLTTAQRRAIFDSIAFRDKVQPGYERRRSSSPACAG